MMNAHPSFGRDFAAELNNPQSVLYKDLLNARQIASANEEARKKATLQMLADQKLTRQITELENELENQREKARQMSRDNLAKYYEEQRQIAMNEVELLNQTKMDPQYYAALVSLDTHVKELVAVQAELSQLHDAHEAVSQEIKENKTQLNNAFMTALTSNRLYEINGNNVAVLDESKYTAPQLADLKKRGQVFSLNTDKLPEQKQTVIKQADVNTETALQQTNAYAVQPMADTDFDTDEEDNADFKQVEQQTRRREEGDFFRELIGRQDARTIKQSIHVRVITITEESEYTSASSMSAKRMTNLLFNLMVGHHDVHAFAMQALYLQERETALRGNIIRSTNREQNLFTAVQADSKQVGSHAEAILKSILNSSQSANYISNLGFGN